MGETRRRAFGDGTDDSGACGRGVGGAGGGLPRGRPADSARASSLQRCTAIYADLTVHEPPPPEDLDSGLAFSMEGYDGLPAPEMVTHYWQPGWNSHQAINKFQMEFGPGLAKYQSGVRLLGGPRDEGRWAKSEGRGVRDPYGQAARTGEAKDKGWLWIVEAAQVFGSEPLSVMSGGTSQCVSEPYVTVGESVPRKSSAHGMERWSTSPSGGRATTRR